NGGRGRGRGAKLSIIRNTVIFSQNHFFYRKKKYIFAGNILKSKALNFLLQALPLIVLQASVRQAVV
ncbi:MAG: hypothetical protein LBB90_12445, partial [Tannerella sp.]|nr:hypothetical protein [Tannerella sp.]